MPGSWLIPQPATKDEVRASGRFAAYHADGETGAVPVCQFCGQRNWHIGHHLAECGKCGNALPLEASEFLLPAGRSEGNRYRCRGNGQDWHWHTGSHYRGREQAPI